jgi:hypothetical protein
MFFEFLTRTKLFSTFFACKGCINIAWWERIPHNEPKLKITDECNRVKILQVFPQFLVFGFFHSFFSVIESSFRIYLRELAPTACNNGTADFKSKYDLN